MSLFKSQPATTSTLQTSYQKKYWVIEQQEKKAGKQADKQARFEYAALIVGESRVACPNTP